MKQQSVSSEAIAEMLEINRRQKDFYDPDGDLTLSGQGNLATRIWRDMRRRQQRARNAMGIDESVYKQHWEWMGDLREKRVLDLGCFSGNVLSLSIAEQCRSYLGIDLSEGGIEELQRKLRDRDLPNAQAIAVDFLSDEFGTERYDIIYAHSVMHHFKHFDAFLAKLRSHVSPSGCVISYDPIQTSSVVKLARAMYRPFQSDAEWEWPFDGRSFEKIQEYFAIDAIQGVMGRAKWIIPLSIVSVPMSVYLGASWRDYDRVNANRLNRSLRSCMQVSMRLSPRSTTDVVVA